MRKTGIILLLVTLTLVVACETPSTTKEKIVPFASASYNAGLDGGSGDFVVYLSEGSRTGPSIQDATVLIDNLPVVWNSYGYYYRFPAAPLVEGEVHTLKISHPTAFDAIEVSLAVPSGVPSVVSVTNPPDSWIEARDTSTAVTLQLTPDGGSWSPDTVVWAKAYDGFGQLRLATPYQPTGSAAVDCLFGVGDGTYTGFSIRKKVETKLPGFTSDSFFRLEGAQVTYLGFGPDSLPDYRANLELRYDGVNWYASAYFTDLSFDSETAQSVTIAGHALAAESSSPDHFYASWAGPALANGDEVSFSFTDPDGTSFTGTALWHSEDLALPQSIPAKGSIGEATAITFPAPVGGWPAGSRVFIKVTNQAQNGVVSSSEYGYGNAALVFDEYSGYPFATAHAIDFRGAIETRLPLSGYRGILRFCGPGVSW